MGALHEPSRTGSDTTADVADVADETLETLRDALGWEMTVARWQQVGQTVDILAAAVARQDVDVIRHATIELELASPVRITRIGTTPREPMPPVIRERANRLIHVLSGGRTAAPTQPAAGRDRNA